MSCKFCEKIWTSAIEYERQLKYCEDTPAVVIDNTTGLPAIYQPCADDSYYSTFVDIPLNFCPVCGRKFTKEEDEI